MDRVEPEFSSVSITLHVDVAQFATVIRPEEKAIWTYNKYGWHVFLPPLRERIMRASILPMPALGATPLGFALAQAKQGYGPLLHPRRPSIRPGSRQEKGKKNLLPFEREGIVVALLASRAK